MPTVILKDKKATAKQLKNMCYELGNYIKIVVDVEKKILAAGATMHYDEEQLLLEYGCKQENLWGGGIDLDTNTLDYSSMINIRPNQDNSSREILSAKIREQFKKIVEELIL